MYQASMNVYVPSGYQCLCTKRLWIFALGVMILPLSTILIFDFRIVVTVWYFFFFVISCYACYASYSIQEYT